MPDDEETLVPRLICSRCTEAIDFYKAVFGALEIERYTSPDGIIVHARMRIGEASFTLADAAPDWNNVSPEQLGGSAVILRLSCEDPEATARQAEDRGATIVFPVSDLFYGSREGRIRDPFGHLWILSKPVAKVSPEAIQAHVDQMG